jgi:hypothetical protein
MSLLINIPLAIAAEEISFGINTVLSLVFGSGGALAVWFSFRNKVDLANQKIDDLEEDNKNAHSRISNLKKDLERHKEITNEFRLEIKAMELRLTKEIQGAITKALNNK